MGRWYYRSVFDELEDLRNYLELLDRQVNAINPAVLLPAAGEPAAKMLPAQRAHSLADTSENAAEVVVTVAMDAGTEKKEIALHLIDSCTLEITRGRTEERTERNGDFHLHGRMSERMTLIVPLPSPVTDSGSSAAFRDGVLEVRLKKTGQKPGRKIPID